MNTDEQVDLYSQLMAEVRSRLLDCRERIAKLRAADPADVGEHHYYDYELCCVHLRFICELVSIGSLIAHHKLGLNSKLLDEWSAGEALKRLEELNSRSFPRAIEFSDIKGKRQIEIVSGRLTFEEMNTLYGRLGNVLHRGPAKNVLKKKARRYDLGQLVEWHNALGYLLQRHIIIIRQTREFFITDLFGGDKGGVRVVVMEGAPEGFIDSR